MAAHPILFVNMNIDRYDNYQNFIRNLSRELFISYKKTIEDKKLNSPELLAKLELLYQQTFYQINETQNMEEILDREKGVSVSINSGTFMNKMMPIMMIVFGSFLSLFNFGNKSGFVTAVLGLCWMLMDSIDFTRKK